ncbi:MAG TPA: aromatic-ring-hydroxylating dioxygenase subunit beta [Stellaceae bacterium]|jgi:salicylate 5-hydroxylase small subunit|nr:aromatic-ring-hydroxylating dioxygenase subunit beta [Stellaceae bacterium]
MIGSTGVAASSELRQRLADLYAGYDSALDEGEYERWPDFFVEAGIYKITPRENYDAGLPVAMVYCESRAMLADRVVAIRETTLYAPRIIRRVMGAPSLLAIEGPELRLAQSFALFETMLNETSTVFLCGRCYDRVADDAGTLRFAERICVTDATNIPLSLIFPI